MTLNHPVTLAVVVVVAIPTMAGCTFPSSDAYEVDFDGPVERTGDGFRMQGEVEVDGTTAPTRNFSDVAIVLYDENQSVIERVPLGDMSTDSSVHPRRRAVNLTISRPPAYVLIDSPDFWDGDVAVMAFRWDGQQYVLDHYEDRDAVFERGSE